MVSSFFTGPRDSSSSGDSSPVDQSERSRAGRPQSGRQEPSRRRAAQPVPPRRTLSRVPSSVPAGEADRNQQMLVFQLSLIEGRCRTQAANCLNAHRPPDQHLAENHPDVIQLARELFAEMSRELVNAGILPPEHARPVHPDLSTHVLTTLDTALQNSAALRSRGLDQPNADLSLDGLSLSGSHGRPQSVSHLLQDPGLLHHAALVRRDSGLHIGLEPAPAMILGQTGMLSTSSVYDREYEQLCMLGRGGYGSVFKVRNHLDAQEYAIKKILISSQRLQRIRDVDQIGALLAELRTLARLNHPNTVRYYHGWIEASNGDVFSPFRQDERLLLDSASQLSGPSEFPSQATFTDTNMSLRAPEISGFNDEFRVSFGYSSSHEPSSRVPATPAPDVRRSNQTSSTVTPKTSVMSIGEERTGDDEVESIPRSFINGPSGEKRRLSPKRELPKYVGPDVTLYIKMSLHQLTLANYLYPGEAKPEMELRHCFHRPPTLRMLRALLDGIEYLHSQRIVHRDLKPANVFLTVHEELQPSSQGGFVDVTACPECPKNSGRAVFLTPCIGDFGLISEIKDLPCASHAVPPSAAGSSAVAALAPRPVGTQFYRPDVMPTCEPIICEKLDVFSFGVIAFEMLHRFDTKSERATVLTKLTQHGEVPCSCCDPDIVHGIMSMLEKDREERWTCADVRHWLDRLEQRPHG